MTTRHRTHFYTEDLDLKFAAVDPSWGLPTPGLPNPAWVPIVNVRDVTTGLYYDAAGPPFWVAGAAPGLPDNAMAPADAAEAPFDAFFTLTVAATAIGSGGVGPDLEVIYEDAVIPAVAQTEMEHVHLIYEQKPRYTRQHDRAQDLILTLSRVAGITPRTLQTPDALIRRSSDGLYWGGAAWGAPGWQAMNEVSAANSPGFYDYTLATGDIDTSDTLYVTFRDTGLSNPTYEQEQVVLFDDRSAASVWDELEASHVVVGSFGESLTDAPSDVWEELEAAHATAGSFGVLAKEISSLVFRWRRDFAQVYNADRQLTQVIIRTYQTQAQYNADAAPVAAPTPAGSTTIQYDITYTNGLPTAVDSTEI